MIVDLYFVTIKKIQLTNLKILYFFYDEKSKIKDHSLFCSYFNKLKLQVFLLINFLKWSL